jgi:hypothetical protein
MLDPSLKDLRAPVRARHVEARALARHGRYVLTVLLHDYSNTP